MVHITGVLSLGLSAHSDCMKISTRNFPLRIHPMQRPHHSFLYRPTRWKVHRQHCCGTFTLPPPPHHPHRPAGCDRVSRSRSGLRSDSARPVSGWYGQHGAAAGSGPPVPPREPSRPVPGTANRPHKPEGPRSASSAHGTWWRARPRESRCFRVGHKMRRRHARGPG